MAIRSQKRNGINIVYLRNSDSSNKIVCIILSLRLEETFLGLSADSPFLVVKLFIMFRKLLIWIMMWCFIILWKQRYEEVTSEIAWFFLYLWWQCCALYKNHNETINSLAKYQKANLPSDSHLRGMVLFYCWLTWGSL